MKKLIPAILAFGALGVEAQYMGRSGVHYANDGTVYVVRRTNDWSQNRGDGWCRISVRIDDHADVELWGEQLRIRPISGAPGRNQGSQCNAPLPASGVIRDFRFRNIEGRGEARLLEGPTPQNGYVAVVNVRDPRGGAARYTFELTWRWDGPGAWLPGRPTPAPPSVLPDMNTSMRGSGTLDYGNRHQNLIELSVRVSGNWCQVTLLTDGPWRLEMTGTVAPNTPRCLINSSNQGRTSANALIHMSGNLATGVDVSGNVEGQNFRADFRSR
jgi:hypothetical protein